MKIQIAIILGAVILGGFYSYTAHEKLVFANKEVQMQIEQENLLKMAEQDKRNRESIIKIECSAYLERNGNYLVSNETLNTNYNACLHARGL